MRKRALSVLGVTLLTLGLVGSLMSSGAVAAGSKAATDDWRAYFKTHGYLPLKGAATLDAAKAHAAAVVAARGGALCSELTQAPEDEARVVDEHVDRTQVAGDLLLEPGDARRVGHVEHVGLHAGAAPGELGGGQVQRLVVQVDEDELRAVRGQPLGDGLADARCAAGDERHLAGEAWVVVHRACGRYSAV
jgi:hypothetical protein